MKSVIRKCLVFFLAMVFCISLAGLPVFADSPTPLGDFKDVPPSQWFYDYVMYLASKSIVKGYGDSGEFRPQNPVIREHAAKMVVLGAGLSYKNKKANFPDVDPNGEMSPYIAALVGTGAVKGFPDGSFRPHDKIKRSHAAKIIQGAFGLKASSMAVKILDLPSHDPGLAQAISILASNGIVKGYGDSRLFKPDDGINRAEFSKILCISIVASAVQKTEEEPSALSFSQAQSLVNTLSGNQDAETKAFLQGRLDAIDDSIKTLTVTFENHDGSLLKTQQVNYGESASAPTVPPRTGYTFKGWDKDFSHVTNHLIVTSQWAGLESKVSFHPNGGGTPDPQSKTVAFGDPYGELATVKHAGVGGRAYRMEGWWAFPAGQGSQVLDTTPVTATSDHTLYAKWTEIFNITRTNENSKSWNRLVITRHQGSVLLSMADAFIRRTEYGWADQGNFSLKIEGDWPVELYGLRFAREGSSPRSLRTLVVTGNGSPSGTFDVNLRVFISLKDNHDISTFFTVRVHKADGTPTPVIDIIALPNFQ